MPYTLNNLFFGFLILLANIATGFIAGVIFDAVMGTNIYLIFMFASMLGINLNVKKEDRNSSGEEIAKHLAGVSIVTPVALWIISYLSVWIFPELVSEFLALIGYAGDVHTLALWGGTIGVAVGMLRYLIFSVLRSFLYTKEDLEKINKK